MDAPYLTIVYQSRATAPLDHLQLMQLLVAARDHNERVGITGLLLHKNGGFMQLLEGPPDAVRDMKSKIEVDPRHHHFQLLLEEPATTRRFAEWSMAFEDADELDAALHPGVSQALRGAPLVPPDSTDVALVALEGFRSAPHH